MLQEDYGRRNCSEEGARRIVNGPRPSMGSPDHPWGYLAPRFSARSVEPHAPGAKPRPTPGRSGLGHVSENGPGATVRGVTKCAWDTPRTELFAQYLRTSRLPTWDAKRAPEHGWTPVGTGVGGGTDRGGSRRDRFREPLPSTHSGEWGGRGR